MEEKGRMLWKPEWGAKRNNSPYVQFDLILENFIVLIYRNEDCI